MNKQSSPKILSPQEPRPKKKKTALADPMLNVPGGHPLEAVHITAGVVSLRPTHAIDNRHEHHKTARANRSRQSHTADNNAMQ